MVFDRNRVKSSSVVAAFVAVSQCTGLRMMPTRLMNERLKDRALPSHEPYVELTETEYQAGGKTGQFMALYNTYRSDSASVWADQTDEEKDFDKALEKFGKKSLASLGVTSKRLIDNQNKLLDTPSFKLAAKELDSLHFPGLVPDDRLYPVLDKITGEIVIPGVLQTFFDHVNEAMSEAMDFQEVPGADELLPVLLFLIIESKPKKILSAVERLYKVQILSAGQDSFNRIQLHGAVLGLVTDSNDEELRKYVENFFDLQPNANNIPPEDRDSGHYPPNLSDILMITGRQSVTVPNNYSEPNHYPDFQTQDGSRTPQLADGGNVCGRPRKKGRAKSSCLTGLLTMMGRARH